MKMFFALPVYTRVFSGFEQFRRGGRKMCRTLGYLIKAALLLSLLMAGPMAIGQVFTEIFPLASSGRFPALKDMRSAWGDFDGDGDFDLIISGTGTNGPVTRLYAAQLASPGVLTPYQEVFVAGLPQVQDGALAWGDFDNDGDLDLAITGSVSATPGPGDLRAYVLRNNGPDGSGGWRFDNVMAGVPWFTPCRFGTVSWGDYDNDGYADLFVSGDASADSVHYSERVRFSRIYHNNRGMLEEAGPRFLTPRGLWAERVGNPPTAYDGSLTRRVHWADIDKDSYLDLVLTADDSDVRAHDGYHEYPTFARARHEIWMNLFGSLESTGFKKLEALRYDEQEQRLVEEGVSIADGYYASSGEALDPILSDGAHTIVQGGVGDWDGDGAVDMVSFRQLSRLHDRGTSSGVYERGVLHQESVASAVDYIPRFSTTSVGPRSEVVHIYALTAQTSADFLNAGKVQCLANVIWDNVVLVPPTYGFMLFADNSEGGLDYLPNYDLGLEPRGRGVLDAVDVDRNGRLDVLHSGFDQGKELQTRLYRNSGAFPANTRPIAPTNLTAQVTPGSIQFRWNAATDDFTPSVALRYAIRLCNSNGVFLIHPSSITNSTLGVPSGTRLLPGFDATLQTTEFFYQPGRGRQLPDGTYRWTVQAIDSSGAGSAFAQEQSFTLDTGPVPPADQETGLPYRDTSIDLGDIDNDGDLDAVLAGHSDAFTYPHADVTVVSLTIGDQSLPTIPALPPIRLGMVRWGDVDGDGDLDLAMSGESNGQQLTRVYRNDSGTLVLRDNLTGVIQSALEWADFDNDGDLDLIVTGYSNAVPLTLLYRNDGATFATQETTLADVGAGAVALADFDNDGDLDLLLCGNTQRYDQPLPPCVAPPYHLRPPNTYYMCGPVAGPSPQPATTLFRNDGLSTNGMHAGKWEFTPVVTQLPSVISYGGALSARAEWCDIDGDGDPDLVLGGMASVPGFPGHGVPSVKIFRNAGPGPNLGEWRFLQSPELLTAVIPRALQTLTCADWDNDGFPDLLLSGRINDPGYVPTHVIHNDTLTFNRRSYLRSLDESDLQFASGLAAFGHYNSDGEVDVVLSGMWGIESGSTNPDQTGTVGNLFLNQMQGTNAPPSVPAGLSATVSGTGTDITFSWQTSTDDHTPTAGLTYNLSVVRTDGGAGGMPGMADSLTGKRRVCRVGNVGNRTSWTLHNLPAGEYRWSVQAIDASLLPSGFATASQTFTAAPSQPPIITPLPPLHQWTVANPVLAAVDLLGVAAGRNARIVVGGRGRLYLSLNQQPFTEVESGVFTDLHDAVIDAEGAIVVGAVGVIRISSDGRVWRESVSGVTSRLRAVERGGTGWVAAGDDVVLHSPDRLSWTPGVLPPGTIVHDVTWGSGRYIAAGERAGFGSLLTSTDGLSWNDVTPPGLQRGRITGVAGDGSRFVAVGGSSSSGLNFGIHSDVLTSLDGLAWTFTQVSNVYPMLKIARSDAGWFSMNYYRGFRSSDGMVWETNYLGSQSFPERFTALAVDDGVITMTAVEGTILDSAVEPADWQRRAGTIASHRAYYALTALAAAGDTIVAIGSFGTTFVSQNGGRSWESNYFGPSDGFHGLSWGAGKFVRTHSGGIDSSPDGVNWTSYPVGHARAITFGNGRFVASRNSGGFFLSIDGEVWNPVSASTPSSISLAFGNSRYLALDSSGSIRTSTDGASWSEISQVSASRLSFARDRFFAMPNFGGLFSSTDGTAWQPVSGIPVGARFMQVIWHRDRYIAVGGPDALLLSSPDAVTWTSAPVATSGTLTATVSADSGLILIGTGQALLRSQDSVSIAPLTLAFNSLPTPGTLRLIVSGRTGQVVVVQHSSDLSFWTDLEMFTLSGEPELIEVEFESTLPNAYFRLKSED